MSSTSCCLCGRLFDCGAADPQTACWCVALPALPRQALGERADTCFCPDCLREQLRQNGLLPQKQEAA